MIYLLLAYIGGTLGGAMGVLWQRKKEREFIEKARSYIERIDGENKKTEDFEHYMRKVHNTGGYGRLQATFRGFINYLEKGIV